MNIILFGPQGSGKGTQARLLSDKFDFFYFESGAYLRRIAEKYPSIKEAMSQGKLVPDEEFTSYLTAYLDEQGLYDQILFDGFPRTLEQYLFLRKWLDQKQVSIDLGIVINIPEEETIRRLSGRRQDPATGKIYNLVTDKPPADVDINSLVQRNDDKPEAIKKRLEWHKDRVVPFVDYLKKNNVEIVEVDGLKSIADVQKELTDIISAKTNKSSN